MRLVAFATRLSFKRRKERRVRGSICVVRRVRGKNTIPRKKVVDARECLKTNEAAERAENESKEAKNIQ